MKIMMWIADCAINLCARFTQVLGLPSKALDFTQPTTEAEKALAHGLWAAYNINLPDTPKRVAMTVAHILEQKGYEIGKTKR
jgi:hypothetical protein